MARDITSAAFSVAKATALKIGLAIPVMLAACGSARDASPERAVSNPTDSAVQVAWTTARAEKCGFAFDRDRLVSSWLQYESSTGGDAAQRRQAYDFAYRRFSATLAKNPKYCNSTRVAETRRDLNRQLKGDFGVGPPPAVEE